MRGLAHSFVFAGQSSPVVVSRRLRAPDMVTFMWKVTARLTSIVSTSGYRIRGTFPHRRKDQHMCDFSRPVSFV